MYTHQFLRFQLFYYLNNSKITIEFVILCRNSDPIDTQKTQDIKMG